MFSFQYLGAIISYLIYPILLKLNKRIRVLGKIKVKGFPNIIIKNNSELIISNGVTLNSMNDLYHINMFSRVKILADGKNGKIFIGENTRIHGSCIHAKSTIHIGKNCLIAANTHIVDSNGHELLMETPYERINSIDQPKGITIHDNVWIAANCFILKGVTIGEGSVIGANSVVNMDIPPYSIASGNPAQVIKTYKN